MATNYLSYKLRALPFYDEVTKAGGKIYAVGGPVRDFILGKQSKDLDIIVTGIDYDLLQGILENYGKTDLVGKSFGIIKFRETPTSEEIDVALPRTERKTGQGYQGFEVTVDPNMSVEDEMKRRDLTINSLAMDGDGNIVDPFNGLNDIKNRIIKATSNDSFSEDPLRMLRVVQFATRFGFNLDSQTESMIKQNANLIKEISPERYIIEFEKIVSKGKPIQGIKLLVDLNLFESIFGFPYNGKFKNFDKVRTIGEFLYLCVLTSENFEMLRKRFGSALSDKVKKEIEALSNLNLFGQNKVENLFTLMKMYKLSPDTIQNSMLIPNELKQMAQKYPMDVKQLDITGMDVMSLGFKGKDIGDKIIEIFKAIFSDQIPNQKQAIIDYLKKDNLNENESMETPKITSFRELVEKSPKELKDILYSNWQAKQNPKWHPEGNTLKHIIVVTNRAIKTEPYNINLILAGYFHDLGKMATYEISPKTGQPTAYGHENISADLVDKYQDFITELGGNPEVVNYIVKNHMRMKPSTWDVMKDVKKDVIKSHPSFSDLEKFSTIDKGGLNEKQELKGGKADKLTLPQIAKKHKLPIEDLTSQLRLGIKTEMEHTDSKKQAKEIAMDHLSEDPKYYTKIKKAKLEEAIGKSLATAALGLGLMGNPSVSKANQPIPISQQQTKKVLAKVSFSRSEPISNPDLDLVHGALGSKRLNDDFEQRVQDELTNQINKGNIPDISNIQVKTFIQGNQIITEASCEIIKSQDGIAYTHFTTRGSIGDNYEIRHDKQVNGLIDRLENYYGGVAKQVGKTFDITFQLEGQDITYRQSFFVAGKSNKSQTQQSQQTQTISGNNFGDLRQKLKEQTKDISINPNSIKIDINNYTISYQLGNQKIKVISLIYDDAGQLENRLTSIKNQNPTLKVLQKGKSGNVDWAVSVIKADENLKEEKIPSKLKSDIQIEYHKSLNPKFWLNNHLKSNIRKKLLALAKFYFKQLDLDIKIIDIIFTGSLANYNYTDTSDIDLHIVVDYKELTDNEDFAKDFFTNKRALWGDSNDIKIFDYPVEIYVQDYSQLNDSTHKGMSGIYSIINNKWIKKPKYKIPDIDKDLIKEKTNKYLEILNKINSMKDSINKIENFNKVFEKIKDKRRDATKKEGEFSVDNLVFKILRNKKVFDIIKNNKKETLNKVFSINSN